MDNHTAAPSSSQGKSFWHKYKAGAIIVSVLLVCALVAGSIYYFVFMPHPAAARLTEGAYQSFNDAETLENINQFRFTQQRDCFVFSSTFSTGLRTWKSNLYRNTFHVDDEHRLWLYTVSPDGTTQKQWLAANVASSIAVSVNCRYVAYICFDSKTGRYNATYLLEIGQKPTQIATWEKGETVYQPFHISNDGSFIFYDYGHGIALWDASCPEDNHLTAYPDISSPSESRLYSNHTGSQLLYSNPQGIYLIGKGEQPALYWKEEDKDYPGLTIKAELSGDKIGDNIGSSETIFYSTYAVENWDTFYVEKWPSAYDEPDSLYRCGWGSQPQLLLEYSDTIWPLASQFQFSQEGRQLTYLAATGLYQAEIEDGKITDTQQLSSEEISSFVVSQNGDTVYYEAPPKEGFSIARWRQGEDPQTIITSSSSERVDEMLCSPNGQYCLIITRTSYQTEGEVTYSIYVYDESQGYREIISGLSYQYSTSLVSDEGHFYFSAASAGRPTQHYFYNGQEVVADDRSWILPALEA